VPETSAKGDFAEYKPLRGDHFKVLKPSRIDDENYKLLAETILDPPGHKAFFELDDFQMHLTVEPRTPPEKILCKHGTHQRFVTTDNVAHLFRTATFSQRNRRRELFSMGYGTRSEGFVSAWGNTGNEAPSNEIGAWEDRGYTFSYQFRPQPGKTYTFNADIYRGYDPGSRDVHFHLKPDRRYRKIGVKLDLCSYLKANWKIVDEPALYFHSHDPGKCGEVCKQRVRKDAIMSQHTGTPGMYSWDFENVSDGVIEVVWDVAQAAPKADAAGQGS